MANFFKPNNKKQSSGQVISVCVDRLDHNGIGVGKYKNKPVFIANTLLGEHVEAKITETKGKFLKAQLLNVITPSEQRVQPNCEHFTQCGGCDLQHLMFDEHLNYKKTKVINLFSRSNITSRLPWQPSITSEPWQYRKKARIGVQYTKTGEPIVGFRQKASNRLTPVKKCPIMVESTSLLFTQLKNVINALTLAKSIGHIEVIYTQHITLVIRQLTPLNKHDSGVWLKVAEQNQWQIYIDNGEHVTALTHTTPLYYQLNTTKHANAQNLNIYFDVNDFIQVNHQVNECMIEQALDWLLLTSEDLVLDLFCGLGNFSLPIAQQAKSVVGVEGLQAMVDKATYNAEVNNLTNVQFFQADLNNDWPQKTWANTKYTKALLDPARAGAYEAIEQLVKLNISHIVYVSCDPSTLAKDSQLLISHGYTIEKIAIMDMFAQTKHIETMVLFKK